MTRAVAALAAAILVVACGSDDEASTTAARSTAATTAAPPATADLDEVVKIGGGRGLHISCAGSGSPTVVMEAGDQDGGDYYAGLQQDVAEVTRACFYDRANLGGSDPAPGPRGLKHLVGDLERLLKAAKLPAPYLLVGSSGGGYIVAGYAVANPRQTAGIVTFDTFAPDPNPPREVVEETDPDNPANLEERDYLQVENDAWGARKRIGDIPVKIVTVDYGAAAEGPAERRNVKDQRGWLKLSPRAEQIVVKTGHAIVFEDPELASKTVLDAVKDAR